MVFVNSIISSSRVALRHWRDVRNRKISLVHVAGCQNRPSPYFPSTYNTFVQQRCVSAAKVLLYQDKHPLPQSDLPATAAAGRHTRSAMLLHTLNQTRLAEEDFVDLTGREWRTVRFPLAPEHPGVSLHYWRPGGRGCIPFPEDSHGFFYWHLDPDAPLVSGQLRFHTTTTSDPATFPNGRDLQLPDGRAWNISLFEIARGSRYSGLRAHLLSEKLVMDKVLDTAMKISAPCGTVFFRPSTGSLLIWKFGQTFLVDFGSKAVSPWVIGSSAAERLHLQCLFSVWVAESGSTGIVKRVVYAPYTGRALIQFERSTLPEHKGTRTVVLRIVKIIEMTKSPASDDVSWMPEPQEGGLVMKRVQKRSWVPWSVDVDRPQRGSGSTAKALTILFDNEADQARRAR
ncbi:hypothetical protein OE88DRAFT_1657322 [Heliocybe sulcata]|uniref:Uncharacterized protein n=1 Tax=Heliocybe sulcata TaxID=5364 RepID=A0A5C3N5T1_9AGAM|nr:hypothetical protein OE88DRAFT_1657322 [Heliocybe sulcata]